LWSSPELLPLDGWSSPPVELPLEPCWSWWCRAWCWPWWPWWDHWPFGVPSGAGGASEPPLVLDDGSSSAARIGGAAS